MFFIGSPVISLSLGKVTNGTDRAGARKSWLHRDILLQLQVVCTFNKLKQSIQCLVSELCQLLTFSVLTPTSGTNTSNIRLRLSLFNLEIHKHEVKKYKENECLLKI